MKHFFYLIIFLLILIISNSYSLDSLKLQKVFQTNSYGRFIGNCDTLNCIAVFSKGNGAKVFKSTDAGLNWFLILDCDSSSTLKNLRTCSFLNPDSILITYQGDSIQRTTNGGLTWDTINTNLKRTIRKTSFLNNGHGIGTDSNFLYSTSDFGSTWTTLSPVTYMRGIDCPTIFNDNTYGCFGYHHNDTNNINTNYYCRSEDSGNTWFLYQIDFYPHNTSIDGSFFIDTLIGWAYGVEWNNPNQDLDNVIFHSKDGGRTWIKQLDTVEFVKNAGLESISFIDSLNGIASGIMKLLTTNDGGKTWILDTNTVFHDWKHNLELSIIATYLTNKKFLAITASGKIYMYNEDGFNDIKIKETINENIPLNIYPNPAITELNINLSSNTYPPLSYQITDLLGKTLQFGFFKDEGFINTLKINVENLKAGVYFINLIYTNRKESGKFVKE